MAISITDPSATIPDSRSFFKGGGEMGALMRTKNWEEHPLGDPDQWPLGIKVNIRLMLNSRFPMFIWWSKDLFSFHNDAYLPALGKKHPQALGMPARKVWGEIWGQLSGIVDNILEGGDPFYTEGLKLFLERNGFSEETYWTFSYSAIYNDAGEVNGIFCACHEQTKTVLGQRRLKTLKDISTSVSRQSLSLAQTCQLVAEVATENASDVPFSLIYLLDSAGAGARLVGEAGLAGGTAPASLNFSAGANEIENPLAMACLSRGPQVLTRAELAEVVPALASHPLASGPIAFLPIVMPGQGEILGFWLSGLSLHLSYDPDYQDFHAFLIEHLATSLSGVQAREGLVRQQEYLSDLFTQAPVAISVLRGPEYVVDLANLGICELWGRKQEEVIGRPLIEALPEIQDQGILELLDGVVCTGVPYVNEEYPVRLTRNGRLETAYFSFLYHPMRDAQGEIAGVIAVAISINEQVEARRALEQKNKELIGINSDLDNFVYSASHDLKAPVANIEGLVQTLVDCLPAETLSSALVSQIIGLIQASVDRFKRVITDLTQVARIQREAEEDVRPVHLAAVVEDVMLEFASELQATGARVETDIPAHAVFQFSAKNARSIVYNLLSNSLKYRSPGLPPLIRVSLAEGPDYMVLSVKDNGLGFDPAEEKKIFSMFKRLHDHVEGTGIGLYIVKKIVENAGGSIAVESQLGRGATFRIFFPR